jgi:hypothetical protein
MIKKAAIGLTLGLLAGPTISGDRTARAQSAPCDRECLRGTLRRHGRHEGNELRAEA